MSETEHRKGKLLPQLGNNETVEDWCLRILKREKKRTELRKYEKDILVLFRDELYQEYYLWEEEIYLIDCEHIDNEKNICEAKKLDNWNIEIELRRYNWLAGVDEMIEQALKNI